LGLHHSILHVEQNSYEHVSGANPIKVCTTDKIEEGKSAEPNRNRRTIFGAGSRRGPVIYSMKVLIEMNLLRA
jgi:hypothetical protein